MEIYKRVVDVAEGAAKMTGTEMTYELYAGLSDYINDARVDLLHLPRLWCADKIVDSAVSLDNVRGDSSYITVRVVDSRVGEMCSSR